MYLIPASAEEKLPISAEEKFGSFGCLFRKLLSDSTVSRKITRIWAVSAYYDIPSIKQLVELIDHIKSQKSELFIVIGTIRIGELEDLQEMEFGNEFEKGSGIRVITNHARLFHSLFHSKGYLVETANRNGMCAIGSMNLTQAGLTNNEEILTYSRYTHYSKVPPLVAGFRKYVEAWCSDERSKEIGAVSEEKEPGIYWMRKGWKESSQGNDYLNKWLPPKFPDIADEPAVKSTPAVKRYFKKLGFPDKLNDSNRVNEREFTLALYRLLFEECGKNSDERKREGVTLRYRDALWRGDFTPRYRTRNNEVGEDLTCSARFDVTLKGEDLPCYIFVYPRNVSGSIRLGVCVEKQKELVDVLQLNVSKLCEKSGTTKGQYWEVYHDGSMSMPKEMGGGRECETTLRKVKARHKHWIKQRRGKELIYLDKLYVAKEVTWENSKKFLARLLHYAIIRAEIKS